MKTVYKCRLCGKTYNESGTANRNLALSVTTAASLGNVHTDAMAPTLTSVHNCQDGSFGISDFQGMQID